MKTSKLLLIITLSVVALGSIGLVVWNNLPEKGPDQKILQEFDSQRSVTLGNSKLIVPEGWSVLEAGPSETENSITVTLIPTQEGPTLTTSLAGATLTLEDLPEGTLTDQNSLQQFAIAAVENCTPEKAQVLRTPKISERNPNAAGTSFIYTPTQEGAENTAWNCAAYSIVSPSSQLTVVFGVAQSAASKYNNDIKEMIQSLEL